MQQQSPQTMNAVPSTPLHLVTTEQIQKYLDENKNLILAIMENQNMGKMAECAQYQAILQKNLMYLAAIADAQPPTSQVVAGSVAPPQGLSPMLHTQTPMMLQQQQAGKLPFQLRPQEQQQQQQHYQLLQLQQHQQFGMGNDGSHYVHMQPGLGRSQQGAPGNTEGRE